LEPKNKQQAVEEMLSKGDTMICLDSGYPEVQVPENHKGKEDLRLVLNLNFRRSISTLPDGIQAELLFGGVPFLCWIPYESLWAVYNPDTGEGYLWPGESPVSLRDLMGDKSGAEKKKADVKPPALAVSPKPSVREETTSAPEEPEKATSRPKKSGPSGPEKKRPQFRVIDGGKKD
jgi:stringent starvation protein B